MMDPLKAAEPARVHNGRRIHDLCAALAREAMKRSAARLMDLGLSPGAYNLLRALGDQDGMTIVDIRKELRVESATVSTLVVRMERDGLIQKAPSPHDKRATVLKATPRAIELLARADPIMAVEASDLTYRLTEGEQAQLVGLLERVLANLSPQS